MNRNTIIADILKLQQKRQSLRSEERSLKCKEKFHNQMPTIANNDLGSNLSKVLPSHLVPTNVGSLKHTIIPHWYEVAFDLGTDPVYGPDFREEQSFQVTQESAFLLTSISRSFNDGNGAGFGAPIQLDIRDNQSSRQFNDEPISIQNIGYKSDPTELAVPLLLQPNASVRITLSSWLSANQTETGNGYHEFAFGGYKVPIEDAEFIMNSILA